MRFVLVTTTLMLSFFCYLTVRQVLYQSVRVLFSWVSLIGVRLVHLIVQMVCQLFQVVVATLKLVTCQTSQGNDSATLTFSGITALRDDDLVNLANVTELAGNSKSAFYLVYRCDAAASSGDAWELITPTDGSNL